MNLLLALLIAFFIGWTVAAADVLFRDDNRPGIFGGNAGTALLLVLSGVGGLFAAGGVLWVFQTIHSSVVIVLLGGGGWLGFTASSRLHVNTAGAINRLLVGVGGLIIIYGVVWAYLRP